jgi:ribosomal protein L16 Arg81 hydroxylase
MLVHTHVHPISRAEFCREYLRQHAAMIRRELERRAERAEASRLAHLALLSERVRS